VNETQVTVPPLIEQVAGPLVLAIDHVTPDPLGSGSFTVTPVADPAPVFFRVTTKPIWEPAGTEAASAVLVIVRFTQPEAGAIPPFAEESRVPFGL
jgi:hypothetical protein